jgi:hypothetical protein
MVAHQIIELAFTTFNVPARNALVIKHHGKITKGYAQIAHARYVVCAILIKDPEWSYHDLAALFNLDVKTVYTGIMRVRMSGSRSELYTKYLHVLNQINKM